MTTELDILNLGLAKISSFSVNNIDPPRTPLERRCAANYPRWRDRELRRRKWRFAIYKSDLTLKETLEDDEKPYVFYLPDQCLRPLRDRINGAPCAWEQRGKFLYSTSETLTIFFIKRVPANDFDDSFIDVLACRIAIEEAEPSTESNTKKTTAYQMYKEAVDEASQLNAFITGEEEPENDEDEGFDFVNSRY